MLTKDQKKQLAKDFIENLVESKAIVVVDYKGINVNEINELRNALREENIKMKVFKKSVAQVALDNKKIELDVRGMDGQLAFIYGGEDEVSAAKIISKFSKDNENLKILAGVLENKAMNQEEMTSLSKLPNRNELLAKVVGSIKAPISGFVNVLGGNLRDLVGVLSAIKDTKIEKNK